MPHFQIVRSLLFSKVLRRLRKRQDAASGGSDLTGRPSVCVVWEVGEPERMWRSGAYVSLRLSTQWNVELENIAYRLG